MNRSHHKGTDWGLQHINIGEDYIILDIGCGGGRTIKKLAQRAPFGKVYGVDISGDSVKVATQTNKGLIRAGHCDIQVSGVSYLPFEDDFFDAVTAVETYYFWPNLDEDLKEVLRVLVPWGKFLIIGEEYLGSKYDERNEKWAETIGMNIHTLEELRLILEKAGFVDIQFHEDYERGWFSVFSRKPWSN
jgi:SAM-dependent methyltransferase